MAASDRYGRAGHVGAEFAGRARQLIREVEAAEPATDACLIRLIDRIGQRLAHKRTLRKDMLIGLVHDWRTAPELQRFRVAFSQTKDEVFEDQLIGARMRPAANAAWNGWEPRLLVERLSLRTGKKSTWMDQQITASISLHAIARWLSRNRDNSEAALLRDLALLSANQEIATPFAVTTPHGRWVGELIAVRDDTQTSPIYSARTFLAADMGAE